MHRRVRTTLTLCLATVAASTALAGLTASAATADPGRTTQLPAHVYGSNANAPGRVSDVPPFGRKLG